MLTRLSEGASAWRVLLGKRKVLAAKMLAAAGRAARYGLSVVALIGGHR